LRCHCVHSYTNPTWDDDSKTRHHKDGYYGKRVVTGSITQSVSPPLRYCGVNSYTNPTWDDDSKTRHHKDGYYGKRVVTGSITHVSFTCSAEVYLYLPIYPLWKRVRHGTGINSFTLCKWAAPKCVFVSRLIWNNSVMGSITTTNCDNQHNSIQVFLKAHYSSPYKIITKYM